MSFFETKGYIDVKRDIAIDFYDVLELQSASQRKREFIKFIYKDPYFLDPYVSLSEEFTLSGDTKMSLEILNDGFKKANELLSDQSGQWPESLEWAWLENRHIIRCLASKALVDWETGDEASALKILRYLLSSNPRDNVGARFYLLAIRENISLAQYEEVLEKDGIVDDMLLDWFERGVEKYPDEFSVWKTRAQTH